MNVNSRTNFNRPTPVMRFQNLLVLLAFFLGVYTLIHEVVWIRMLTFYYGSPLFVAGTVTITLFLGFAIGNMMFCTIIDAQDYVQDKIYILVRPEIEDTPPCRSSIDTDSSFIENPFLPSKITVSGSG